MNIKELQTQLTVPVTVRDRNYNVTFTHSDETGIVIAFRVQLNTGEKFEPFATDWGWNVAEPKFKPILKALKPHLDNLLFCYDYPHFTITLPFKGEDKTFWIAEKSTIHYTVFFDGSYYCDIERRREGWVFYSTSKVNTTKRDETLVNKFIAAIEKKNLVTA